MHFVHTVPFVALAPFTLFLSFSLTFYFSFLFHIFLQTTVRPTFLSLYSYLFFFIVAGEYYRRDPSDGEATLSLLACPASKEIQTPARIATAT